MEYPDAPERTQVFEAQVKRDASVSSFNYVDLVGLSIRQASGAAEPTVPKNDNGYNVDGISVFTKVTGPRTNGLPVCASPLPSQRSLTLTPTR